MESVRSLFIGPVIDKNVAYLLLGYAESLLKDGRKKWVKPEGPVFGIQVDNFVEEIFAISIRVLCSLPQRSGVDQEIYRKTCSLLLFSSTQLDLLDEMPQYMNKIAVCIHNYDVLVPFFVKTRNLHAISAIVKSQADSLNPRALLHCVKALASKRENNKLVFPNLPKVEKDFPGEAANIRAFCTFDVLDEDTYLPALQIVEQAIAIPETQNNPDLYYNAALLSAQSGNLQQARSYLKKSLSIRKDHIPANVLIIRLTDDPTQGLLKVRNSKSEIGSWDKFILLEGLRLASATEQKHFFDDFHRKIVKRWPNDTDVCEKIMSICLAYDQQQEAVQAFGRWSKIKDKSHSFYYYSAQVAVLNGSFQDAEIFINKAINSCPMKPEYHAAYAMILKKMRRNEVAMSSAMRAISLGPKCAPAWKALSFILTGEKSIEAMAKSKELESSRIAFNDLCLSLSS